MLSSSNISRELAVAVIRGIASTPGAAPVAATLASALVQEPGVARDAAEHLCNEILNVNPPSKDAFVEEATERIKADAATGGEQCMDQGSRPGVQIYPAGIAGTVPWRRGDETRGAAEWLVPDSSTTTKPTARILYLHGGAYEWYSPSDVYRPVVETNKPPWQPRICSRSLMDCVAPLLRGATQSISALSMR